MRLLRQDNKFTRISAGILECVEPLEVAVVPKAILLGEKVSEHQERGRVDVIGRRVAQIPTGEDHIRGNGNPGYGDVLCVIDGVQDIVVGKQCKLVVAPECGGAEREARPITGLEAPYATC